MALKLPTMKMPRVDVSKIKLPEVELKRPDFDFKLPEVELKRPDIDLPDLSKLSLKDANQAVSDIREAVAGGLTAVGRGISDWHRPQPLAPPQRGYGAAGVSLLAGMGVGMGLMYFFDPEQGNRRRALLRDKLVRFGNVAGRSLQGTTRDLGNRAGGLAAGGRGLARRAGDLTSAGQESSDSLVAQTPDASQQLAQVDQAAPLSDQGDADRWTGGDAGQAGGADGTTGAWSDADTGAGTTQTSDAERFNQSWETTTTGGEQAGPFGEADRDDDQEVRIRLG